MVRWVRLVATGSVPSVLAATRYRVRSTATGDQLGPWAGALATGSSAVALTPTTGCATVPDVATGVTGTPAPGVDADGYLVEALIGGTDPVASAEDGWPTFGDWPASNSLLHEQAYYRGVERAWQSGLRVMTAFLVENRVICELYPTHRTACDEMESVRLQAEYLHDLQDYVDAQNGGPEQGWFRIATTPEDVRSIAAQGKLAVLIGIEVSELFGCRLLDGAAQCDEADVDAGLDEVQSWGVSTLYPVHKFDNAFGCTRFDEGATGAAINLGNLISTGSWWRTESCTRPSDHTQPFADDDLAEETDYPGVVSAHTWSDRAVVDEVLGLGGFVASYGYAAGDAGNGEPDLLTEWRANHAGANDTAITGYGYGSDVNGLAPQAPPRLDATSDPLVYPFTAPNGVTVDRQQVGSKTYDLNVDGVAQYGLYADWVADLLHRAGPDADRLEAELMRGAEAYVAMWEQARA